MESGKRQATQQTQQRSSLKFDARGNREPVYIAPEFTDLLSLNALETCQTSGLINQGAQIGKGGTGVVYIAEIGDSDAFVVRRQTLPELRQVIVQIENWRRIELLCVRHSLPKIAVKLVASYTCAEGKTRHNKTFIHYEVSERMDGALSELRAWTDLAVFLPKVPPLLAVLRRINLQHGDFYNRNILFRHASDDLPADVLLTDFDRVNEYTGPDKHAIGYVHGIEKFADEAMWLFQNYMFLDDNTVSALDFLNTVYPEGIPELPLRYFVNKIRMNGHFLLTRYLLYMKAILGLWPGYVEEYGLALDTDEYGTSLMMQAWVLPYPGILGVDEMDSGQLTRTDEAGQVFVQDHVKRVVDIQDTDVADFEALLHA